MSANFFIKAKKFKYFCNWCPKNALRVVKTKFVDFFFLRGIRTKKLEKIKKFPVGVLGRLFERREKNHSFEGFKRNQIKIAHISDKADNH